MARITFSIPDDLAKLAKRRATEDRRSLSTHIGVLVERDAREAGLMPGKPAARIVTAAKELGEEEALKLVTSALRRRNLRVRNGRSAHAKAA